MDQKMSATFRTPVVVEPGVIGRFRVVRGLVDALDVLEGRWPEDRKGPAHAAAVASCRSALDGEIETSVARRAFVSAARDAGILLERRDVRHYTLGSQERLEPVSSQG
jgi:hypothetical protein